MKLKAVDTLFLRIFLLLLVALTVSSFIAFEVFQATAPGPHHLHPQALRMAASGASAPFGPRHPPWLPIGIDAALKVIAGAVVAWFAARALSLPMRRLSDAARQLGRTLSPASNVGLAVAPPLLDEGRGTREVRETARVFNELARQLKTDFDTQRLLLATVSHDLRTPLTRLRMRLAELEDHPAAQRAIEDVHQMDELIESLLALFRPPGDDAQGAGEARRIDAFALVQAIVDDLTGRGPEVTLAGTTAATRCPPAALRRMVENLLENAIRHGGESGSIELQVRVAGAMVEICIADRGPGLSVEQLSNAGTPFLRWAGMRDDRQAGLGLGLYITRALAEREGGALALSAREGGGLCATLALPLAA